jgi:hypothetical protein
VLLLKDIAKYVRSKNAGPFWVTIDIFCNDEPTFRQLCAAEPLKPEALARLYGVALEHVAIFRDEPLKVIKISFPRAVVQGSAQDVDSHAGQYFVALLNVPICAPTLE